MPWGNQSLVGTDLVWQHIQWPWCLWPWRHHFCLLPLFCHSWPLLLLSLSLFCSCSLYSWVQLLLLSFSSSLQWSSRVLAPFNLSSASPLVKSLRHCFNASIPFACAKFWVLVHTLWKSLLQALILILSFTLQPSNRFLIIDSVFLFNCMMRMISLIAQVMRNKPDSKYETMGRGEALS